MAERPIFVPQPDGLGLVREIYFDFKWHSGFAHVQKEKNISALHAAAAADGYSPLLEISTKSEKKVGRHLSAFHLMVSTRNGRSIHLECAFQGSKVFENGGPYTDLYGAEVRAGKRDPRIKESGKLTGFIFDGFYFPLEPKTSFYDWLYLNAILPHSAWLKRLYAYAGFTDIEFNPYKSINCQARSCALFVALMKKDLLTQAAQSPDIFISLLRQYAYHPHLREDSRQRDIVHMDTNGQRPGVSG